MRESDLPDHLTVPNGFALSTSRGLFTNHNGPIYRATAEGDDRSGFFVLERHCNGMGFLHGGMTSAFADAALAWAVWNQTQKFSVTLKLTLQYFEPVRLHAWLEAEPKILSVEDGIAHVYCDLRASEKGIAARADATFRTLRRTRK